MNGAPEAPEPADDGKTIATWTATLALHGHGLYRLASGGFLVTRGGLTRELPDLRAVASLARQIGATKGPR